jgi:hypothetical protein
MANRGLRMKRENLFMKRQQICIHALFDNDIETSTCEQESNIKSDLPSEQTSTLGTAGLE